LYTTIDLLGAISFVPSRVLYYHHFTKLEKLN